MVFGESEMTRQDIIENSIKDMLMSIHSLSVYMQLMTILYSDRLQIQSLEYIRNTLEELKLNLQKYHDGEK